MADNNNNRGPVKDTIVKRRQKGLSNEYKRVVKSHYKQVMESQISIYRIYNFG